MSERTAEEKAAELTALQAALAAEHAAVYGYGVVGGRIREGRMDRGQGGLRRAPRPARRAGPRGAGPGRQARGRVRRVRPAVRGAGLGGGRTARRGAGGPGGRGLLRHGAGVDGRGTGYGHGGSAGSGGPRGALARRERTLPWSRRAGRDPHGLGDTHGVIRTGTQDGRTVGREQLAHGFRTAAASGEGARGDGTER